jgi:hypothetical protein
MSRWWHLLRHGLWCHARYRRPAPHCTLFAPCALCALCACACPEVRLSVAPVPLSDAPPARLSTERAFRVGGCAASRVSRLAVTAVASAMAAAPTAEGGDNSFVFHVGVNFSLQVCELSCPPLLCRVSNTIYFPFEHLAEYSLHDWVQVVVSPTEIALSTTLPSDGSLLLHWGFQVTAPSLCLLCVNYPFALAACVVMALVLAQRLISATNIEVSHQHPADDNWAVRVDLRRLTGGSGEFRSS